MNKLKAVWKSLDGRKTFVSAVLVTVYFLGVEHGVWASHEQLEVLLQLFFGVGVGHKAVKHVKRTA